MQSRFDQLSAFFTRIYSSFHTHHRLIFVEVNPSKMNQHLRWLERLKRYEFLFTIGRCAAELRVRNSTPEGYVPRGPVGSVHGSSDLIDRKWKTAGRYKCRSRASRIGERGFTGIHRGKVKFLYVEIACSLAAGLGEKEVWQWREERSIGLRTGCPKNPLGTSFKTFRTSHFRLRLYASFVFHSLATQLHSIYSPWERRYFFYVFHIFPSHRRSFSRKFRSPLSGTGYAAIRRSACLSPRRHDRKQRIFYHLRPLGCVDPLHKINSIFLIKLLVTMAAAFTSRLAWPIN